MTNRDSTSEKNQRRCSCRRRGSGLSGRARRTRRQSGRNNADAAPTPCGQGLCRTAAYDAAISNWFASELKTDAPDFRAFGGRLIQALRYAKTRIRRPHSIARPDKRPGVATARSCRARSCRTTTSTIRMRPMNASPNSIRRTPRPASSSSMPTPAGSPRAPICQRLPQGLRL